MNVAQVVLSHDGDRRAVHDAAGWHTWDEIRRQAAATAATCHRLGVGLGDRVVVAWPASAGFVATYLGILAAGAVAVPVNPASPVPEMIDELAAVSPALALCSGAGGATVREAARAQRAAVPVLESEAAAGAWDEAMAATVESGASSLLSCVPRAESDPAVLLFTSGTAGEPKPAILSHGNLLANLAQLRAVPGVAAGPHDVGLAALPLFHVFGLNVALGLALVAGMPLVVGERFDPEATAAQVRDLAITMVLGAPTAYAHWAAMAPRRGGEGTEAFASVRLAVAGGAALGSELAADFERRFGVGVDQGYGLTEASPAVSTTIGTDRARRGSVGWALPGVEVRVVDRGGADVLEGDPGEIWVRGPNVFAGYWHDATATAAVLGSDGWLRTGDVGVVGDAGELYLVDRRKDLIIVSGFNVYPAEVERVLARAPGVAAVAVVGRPDPITGEAVDAVVVPAAGGDPPSVADLTAHCRASLASYKCPTRIRFVDTLPRNTGGEALRRKVRDSGREPAREVDEPAREVDEPA